MYRVKCPYCGRSNGNDDRVVEAKYYRSGDNLEAELTKECDICYRKYIVRQKYELKYEELEVDEG